MPASTSQRGYTYATSGDANDLALISQRLAEQIDADVQAQAGRLTTLETDTDWVQITTFNTGWSGYVGGGWNGVVVRKVGRTVYVAGAVTKSGTVVNGETAFTLPVGFRPARQTIGWATTGLWPTFTVSGNVTVQPGTVPTAIAGTFLAAS